MIRFSYKGYDPQGRAIAGEIDGESREDAYSRLRKEGHYPTELTSISAGAAMSPPPADRSRVFGLKAGGMTAGDLLLFTRELAMLTSAALPLDEALRIVVLNNRMSKSSKRIVSDVHDRIIGGSSLGDALGMHPSAFPGFYVRSIGAAERSGKLAPTLEQLMGNLERRADLAQRLRTALTYPAFLLLAASLTLGLVMTVLVPTLSALFEDAGVALPGPLAILRALQRTIATNWTIAFALLAFASLAAHRALQSDVVRRALARLILRLPIAGRIVRDSEQVRFADTLSMLLASGVPVLEALQSAAAAQGNPVYRSVVSAFAVNIAEGGSLSQLIAGSTLFDELLARLVAIGEQAGTLDTMLGRAAHILAENQRYEVDRLVSLLGPAMTVIVGGLIGLIVISIISALGGLNELAFR